MKKLTVLLILLCLIATSAQAQKIKKNEVDKFTNSKIIETSSESLFKVSYMLSGYQYMFKFSIRCVNGEYSMPSSILLGSIEKYTEDSGVTFLLSNSETITLKTAYTGIGGESYGAGYMFHTVFTLSKSDVDKLKEFAVTNIRISYMGGHYDKEIKDKNQKLISKMIKLVEGKL